MDDRNVTSEEKLLKVIRKQDKIKSSTPKGAKTTESKAPKAKAAGKESITTLLKFFNFCFIIVLCVFASLAGYKYFFEEQNAPVSGSVNKPEIDQEAVLANEKLLNPQPSLDNLPMMEREIFQSPWEKEVVEEAVEQEVIESSLPELESIIRVAGIVVDRLNSQVIVEDLESGVTLFLSEGNQVKGAQLIEIHETKAVFMYDQQRVEVEP